MVPSPEFSFIVSSSDAGQRLDFVVASHIIELTRSAAAHLIRQAKVTINGEPKRPAYRVRSGDHIEGRRLSPAVVQLKPQPIDIDILYEDRDLVVINKPPGLVVHPAPGHASGTLVNALLHHCPDLAPIKGEIRPGIVHRLDKDTSGLIVAAKNPQAHSQLTAQFAAREVRKIYLALVCGQPSEDTGRIELPVGRHATNRKRMSTASRRPRAAVTEWSVSRRFPGLALLELDLKTGRTHQARVHCSAMGYPIAGDPVYGGRKALKQLPRPVADLVKEVSRQMLHAWRLAICHPRSKAVMRLEAPVASDMRDLLKKLEAIAADSI
jgi:23S rRNA pseudouridine1911/1915/1917 synthase